MTDASPAQNRGADLIIGFTLTAILGLVILSEWGAGPIYGNIAALLSAGAIAAMALRVGWTRRIFVVVGMLMSSAAIILDPQWLSSVGNGLKTAAFIGAFFTALTSLRHAADTSSAITTCGQFLAEQPPGRRYAALTLGGNLFGLLLSYGAIALLGSLAMNSAKQEENTEIRGHRERRMLLAIQRGFVATLPWSPLAFSMAISLSLVPGATWAGAFLPCLVSGLIVAGIGWSLDTIFKPKLTPGLRASRAKPDGSWRSLSPLVGLLLLLVISVGGLHLLTGIRAVGVVIVVVPIIASIWILIQATPDNRIQESGSRLQNYISRDLTGYRGELVLLMMAGFIGTLGSTLLAPVVTASGLDLSGLPAWIILVALIWIIPLTGQFGMNPILSVSLIAPILPNAASLGLSPANIVMAITAGWSLTGASSPYTATTLLIGSFGGVSASHV
ncbi:MAG: hypothetical protein HKP40_02510, partial [Litoreibacter sp.]|nr:hypothetical protein [Litoreibacter sp.]